MQELENALKPVLHKVLREHVCFYHANDLFQFLKWEQWFFAVLFILAGIGSSSVEATSNYIVPSFKN